MEFTRLQSLISWMEFNGIQGKVVELLCLEMWYYHPIYGIFRENMIEHDDTPPDLGVFLDKPIMMI